MKINKTALKAIKDTHEKMNNIITNEYNSGVLENIEDEILKASELCDNLNIEVSDDEITLIRFLVGHAMYRGFHESLSTNTATDNVEKVE